jgi:hypothetical protein
MKILEDDFDPVQWECPTLEGGQMVGAITMEYIEHVILLKKKHGDSEALFQMINGMRTFYTLLISRMQQH